MADSKADAPFVFEGTVKSLSASNVTAVPADEKTAVVQVDHVRHAPRVLAGFAGKEVTLRMGPSEKLAAGEKAIFYTDSLVFADQLAVQSMGHDPVPALEAKAALAGASPVVQKLRRRIDSAHTVVSGEVTEVRPTPPAAVHAMAAGPSAQLPRFISEHDPSWHEAVISVSDVHKGPSQKKVVVRFPSSTDVRWRKAPRFKKGQKGIWLLHAPAAAAEPVSAAAVAKAAAAPPAAGFYTALNPDDFHPATEAPVVQAMLPAAEPKAKKSAAGAAAAKRVLKAVARSAAKAAAKAAAKRALKDLAKRSRKARPKKRV